MSPGFLIWTDFHPILVGAGCLALGYVYGRHCRSVSEIPADVPPASDDVCCAQSQSNTYYEDLDRPCKCCVSAPAQLDGIGEKASKLTRSPFLVQDAAEGFKQADRSTKRGLANRMVLEEERFLHVKTPYKKQKGSLSSKGKAEMGFDPLSSDRVNDDDSAAPWSREVLHKRIDYFNHASETSAESGRTDESRKLRLIKKKFLKVSSKAEPAYNSTSATADTTGVVRSGSTSGLVELATVPQAEDGESPSSPYRISGGGGSHMAAVVETSVVDPVLQKTFGNPLPTNCKDSDREGDTVQQLSCDPSEKQGNEVEAASLNFAGSQLLHSIQAELLQIPSATSRTPENYVAGSCGFREDVPGDEVLKAEIFELLNETDCTKVSFEEIVSLLENRLQANLQERKGLISDLVHEVVSISQLLEKEWGATPEEKSEAMAVQSWVKHASSSRVLEKWPCSYDWS